MIIVLIPGCDIVWTLSKIDFRNSPGIYGLGTPVALSQYMKLLLPVPKKIEFF